MIAKHQQRTGFLFLKYIAHINGLKLSNGKHYRRAIVIYKAILKAQIN